MCGKNAIQRKIFKFYQISQISKFFSFKFQNYIRKFSNHIFNPSSGFGIGMQRIQQPWLRSDFLFKQTKISKQLDGLLVRVEEYIHKVVDYNKKLTVEMNGANRCDKVIDLLLDGKNNFTDKEIRDEMIIFALTVSGKIIVNTFYASIEQA